MTYDYTLSREGLFLGRTKRRLEIICDRTLPREGLSLERTSKRLGTIYNRTKIIPKDLRVEIMVSNLRTARFP
jgi:hypothetical protein